MKTRTDLLAAVAITLLFTGCRIGGALLVEEGGGPLGAAGAGASEAGGRGPLGGGGGSGSGGTAGGNGGNGRGGGSEGGGGSPEPGRELCDNGVDDDDDGFVDCEDTTCVDAPSCATCGIDHLVISEVRARGGAGAADEYVEIFNPTSAPITLDAGWTIAARGSSASTYQTRYQGDGSVVVPALGFALFVGTSFDDGPEGDGLLEVGIADSSSVVLSHDDTPIDALCFYCGDDPFTPDYQCEGTPVQKDCPGNVDADSVERDGCTDTDDNAFDFVLSAPGSPEDTVGSTRGGGGASIADRELPSVN